MWYQPVNVMHPKEKKFRLGASPFLLFIPLYCFGIYLKKEGWRALYDVKILEHQQNYSSIICIIIIII